MNSVLDSIIIQRKAELAALELARDVIAAHDPAPAPKEDPAPPEVIEPDAVIDPEPEPEKKPRKKRGPNKPKPEPVVEDAEPAKTEADVRKIVVAFSKEHDCREHIKELFKTVTGEEGIKVTKDFDAAFKNFSEKALGQLKEMTKDDFE